MKSGLPHLQRGREIASHSVVGSFRPKGAGKDCWFHTSRTEKLSESWSLIHLKIRHPLGSHWIHPYFEGMSRTDAASHRKFLNGCPLFSSFSFLIFLFTESHGYHENPHCSQGIPSFKKVYYSIMEDYQVASAWFTFDKSMLIVSYELVLQNFRKENIILYLFTMTGYTMMLRK